MIHARSIHYGSESSSIGLNQQMVQSADIAPSSSLGDKDYLSFSSPTSICNSDFPPDDPNERAVWAFARYREAIIQNRELQKKNDTLLHKQDEYREKIERTLRSNREVKETCTLLTQKLQRITREKKGLEDHVQTLQNTIESQKSTAEAIRKQRTSERKMLETVIEKNTDANTKIRSLEEVIHSQKQAHATEIESIQSILHSEIQTLRADLNTAEAREEALRQDIKQLQNDIERKQSELEAAVRDIAHAKELERQAQHQVLQIQQDLRDEANHVADLREKAQRQLQHTRDTEVALEETKTIVTEQRQMIESCEQRIREYRDTIDKQRESLEATAYRIVQLQQQRDEYLRQLNMKHISSIDTHVAFMEQTEQSKQAAMHTAMEQSKQTAVHSGREQSKQTAVHNGREQSKQTPIQDAMEPSESDTIHHATFKQSESENKPPTMSNTDLQKVLQSAHYQSKLARKREMNRVKSSNSRPIQPQRNMTATTSRHAVKKQQNK